MAEEEPIDALDPKIARVLAFRSEADPIFFKVQRGEAEHQDWLDKVQEIRDRFPYPEENQNGSETL